MTVNQWIPDNASPKAIVVLLHGMGDHSMRYEEMGQTLAQSQFLMVSWDLFGHGNRPKTPAQLGHFPFKNGIELLLDEIDDVINTISQQYAGIPIFLCGHSWGSFVAQAYAMRSGYKLSGLILSGTFHCSMIDSLLVMVGQYLSRLLCSIGLKNAKAHLFDYLTFSGAHKAFKPNRTPLDWLSRDHKIVDACISDYRCNFICSNAFYYNLFRVVRMVSNPQNIQKISRHLPILFIAGTHDPLGKETQLVKKQIRLYKKNRFENIQSRFYPEARHEVLLEINRAEVYQDCMQWLQCNS